MFNVCIVVPIYKSNLNGLEKISLSRVFEVLGRYPIYIIKPESLDLSFMQQQYHDIMFESFDDNYFRGISAYNRLMLSNDFYSRFTDYKYILIYQLDAYVFSDSLEEWCAKDYDYIGAPWLRKPIYNYPIISQWMSICYHTKIIMGSCSKQSLYNKVGNGGLSLRKVDSHIRFLAEHKELVEYYINQKRHHLYNEDVFWATEPKDFKYPLASEAVFFAFDKYPRYCYKLTKGVLPFGCHAWYKGKMRSFWKNIINF